MLTVFVGVVAVPLAFYAFHEGPQPVSLPAVSPSIASAASTSR